MDRRFFKKLRPIADQVIAAYENGQSLADIGETYKCSPSTVSSLLKEFNIIRRRKGPKELK